MIVQGFSPRLVGSIGSAAVSSVGRHTNIKILLVATTQNGTVFSTQYQLPQQQQHRQFYRGALNSFFTTTTPLSQAAPTTTSASTTATSSTTAADAVSEKEVPQSLRKVLPSQKKSKGDRVVVLGSGWGGFQLLINANKELPLTIVSPRNHFVFTPLLPSSAVGTLECRCIQEPVRSHLGPNGSYVHAQATSLDTVNRKIICESDYKDKFEIEYDKLVIAVGFKNNTFGIKSIEDAQAKGDCIFFLKQMRHARAIRTNIIDSFEKAALPTVCENEKRRLLSFVIVGGGPTSCEFTAELHDFVKDDVKRLYPDLLPFVKITMVEAGPTLLGPFDKALQDYAFGLFKKRDIDVRLGTAVLGVEDFDGPGYNHKAKRAMLSDGTDLEFGTMVWSAGLAPQDFTKSLTDNNIQLHPRNKRILVDEYLRVKGHEGTIWAIGDAAINETGPPLPQLAQVARQQGIYLADVLNGKRKEDEKPFEFFSLGSMAFLGEYKGVYDGSSAGKVRSADEPAPQRFPALTGLAALVLWRFAYWGRQVSWVNKFLIPVHWLKTFFFGRDVSRY